MLKPFKGVHAVSPVRPGPGGVLNTMRTIALLLAASAVAEAQIIRPRNFQGHDHEVAVVMYTPDGTCLLSGSQDGTIRLWEIKTEKEIRRYKAHEGARVQALDLWQDKKRLLMASGASDTLIKIWDLTANKELKPISGSKDAILSLRFMKDGRRLVATNASGAQFWYINYASDTVLLEGHTDLINSVALSPDDKILATGSSDKTIKLWDVKDEEELKTLKVHTDWVRCVAFSPDGKYLASGSRDETVKIWDVQSGMPLLSLDAHRDGAYCVAWRPDGKMIATSGGDRRVKVWEIPTGKKVHDLYRHTGIVFWVAWSPNGKSMATASADKTVKLWELEEE